MYNEKEILKRLREDLFPADMELIINHYQKVVFSFVYRITGDYHYSEDITQETFIRAFKYIKGFDTGKKFFPWLLKIGKNVSINYINKNKKYILLEDKIIELLGTVDDETDLIEKRDIVEQLLKHLTLEERELMFMRFNLNLSHKEISEVTRINESTVRSKISRGLKKLKKKVKDKNEIL
ncbi:RNA polymerase sigma factor [bacterium]|nr:RNA polymerase sigma factor [bacterium]